MPVSRPFSRLCSALCALFLALSAHAQINPILLVPGGPCSSLPSAPHFSVKSGAYQSPLSVRLKDSTRGAIIFYTTDGWTPTSNSPRYLGPIAVDVTTALQAIALVPNCSISRVAAANYALPSAPLPLPSSAVLPVALSGQGAMVLGADVQVPLFFASPVSSRTAQIGDTIAFTLAQDPKIDDATVVPKGSPATGKVIQVDRSQAGDGPGQIQFQVDSLTVNGAQVPLHAVEDLFGRYVASPATDMFAGFATAGLAVLLTHGKDVQIPAGAKVTATLAAGTALPIAGTSATAGPGPAN